MNYHKMLACAGDADPRPAGVSPDCWFSGFLAVPQHFVCPLELYHGESGKHPPVQFVASADSDLRGASHPSLSSPSAISSVPTSHGPQESMSLKKGNHSEILNCSWTISSLLKAGFVVQNLLMFSSILFCLQN